MKNKLPPDIALAGIQRTLHTTIIGNTILRYGRVGSTNDIAKARARTGYPEGLVVLADEQTVGRGRMGRTWVAPPAQNLLLSLLLRPPLAAADAFLLTMATGLALCDAVEQATGVAAALKWPNDLLLALQPGALPHAKAAGVLSELGLEGERLSWIVIGIGLNVNAAPQEDVDGKNLAHSATSIAAAAGRTIDRAPLLIALLQAFDARYAALQSGERLQLYKAWRERLATLGQHVEVRLPHTTIHGTAEDVDAAGALLVRDDAGVLHLITAGDVQAV